MQQELDERRLKGASHVIHAHYLGCIFRHESQGPSSGSFEVLPLNLLREHDEARDMLRDILGSPGQEQGWSDSLPRAGLTLRKGRASRRISERLSGWSIIGQCQQCLVHL